MYPGSKRDESDPGFVNWSYWLMLQLCDYYDRSGDREFVDACRPRVEEFVEGLLSLRGKSGLIETERGAVYGLVSGEPGFRPEARQACRITVWWYSCWSGCPVCTAGRTGEKQHPG